MNDILMLHHLCSLDCIWSCTFYYALVSVLNIEQNQRLPKINYLKSKDGLRYIQQIDFILLLTSKQNKNETKCHM